eukprot:COSAG04_NODE_68_length_29323_cov_9.683514_28_plen_376_part_00
MMCTYNESRQLWSATRARTTTQQCPARRLRGVPRTADRLACAGAAWQSGPDPPTQGGEKCERWSCQHLHYGATPCLKQFYTHHPAAMKTASAWGVFASAVAWSEKDWDSKLRGIKKTYTAQAAANKKKGQGESDPREIMFTALKAKYGTDPREFTPKPKKRRMKTVASVVIAALRAESGIKKDIVAEPVDGTEMAAGQNNDAANEQELQALFDQHDDNGNGVLEMDELRPLVERLLASSGQATNDKEQVDKAMKDIDADGNGSVCFAELEDWWTTSIRPDLDEAAEPNKDQDRRQEQVSSATSPHAGEGAAANDQELQAALEAQQARVKMLQQEENTQDESEDKDQNKNKDKGKDKQEPAPEPEAEQDQEPAARP